MNIIITQVVAVHACMYDVLEEKVNIWKSQDNFVESILFHIYMNFKDWTRVAKLIQQAYYMLSLLGSPILAFLIIEL